MKISSWVDFHFKHTSHSTFQIQSHNHTVQSVSKLHLALLVEHMHRPLPTFYCNLHNFRWSRILLHIANVISLWPSEAIWWQGSRSTLVQVMACCLTTTSHYLNQCWLVITKVQWCSSEGNFTFNRHHSHQSLKLAWCVKVKLERLSCSWRVTCQLNSGQSERPQIHMVSITSRGHNSCVTRVSWHPKSSATEQFVQQFVQTKIKENIKALFYWPFVRRLAKGSST